MRKLKLFAIAAVLTMGMSITASAADVSSKEITDVTTNNTANINIEAAVNRTDTYKITVGWGEMKFNYNVGTWNTTGHTWDNGGWDIAGMKGNNNKITLTNDSSQPVSAGFAAAITDTTNIGNSVTLKMYRNRTEEANSVTFGNEIATGATGFATQFPKDTADTVFLNGGELANNQGLARDVFLEVAGTPTSLEKMASKTVGTVTVTITEPVTVTP